MKHKQIRLLFSLLLVLSILLSLPIMGHAQEGRTLVIPNEARFLQFAENCRLDANSEHLTVILSRDLDLTGLNFQGIPQFLGVLDGNHHKITGLNITSDGSNMGLIRFLRQGALVKNLTVCGTVAPEGSALNAGGIAGINEGTIKNCRFEGRVSGVDRIGGIAGVNTLTGILENCRTEGSITGDHFLGGAAGENNGVIRGCVNSAEINTQPRENTVNVKSISLETITGTESPSTVTDIGGIAGSSIGVMKNCRNLGQVGYPHMGYNVGGIAGSHQGYLENCQNYGPVYGRKEVGGIAGQLEPISSIQYSIDTLQILEQQLSGASSLLNRAAYNAQGNLGDMGQGISDMLDASEDARDAIAQLTPQDLLDPDTILAAHNTVKSNIQSMYETMGELGETAGKTAGQLSQDIRAVASQLSAMGQTIRDADENLGIRLRDVSDSDTEDDLSAKIFRCQNHGAVSGDLNAGGIAGSMAYENDLDPEEDLQVSGNRSLNFEGSLRAVILDCSNQGTVSGKKLHAGGIVGWMSMGLVKNCVNTGILDGDKVQQAGGIAGCSKGYIRNCYVKCEIQGSSTVGGIAGSGTIVTDCVSMVDIRSGSEKTGAILGIQEPSQDEEVTEPVKGNLYLCLQKDYGGIDGLSLQGQAEPVAPHRFRQLPNLPETFQKVLLTFENPDGSRRQQLILPIGTVFHPEDVPEVPEKQGFTGQWENLQNYVSKRVYFDTVLKPLYTPHRMTISSSETRLSGRPVLLAEGIFPDQKEIVMTPGIHPDIPHETVLEAWNLTRLSQEPSTVLHFLVPEGAEPENLKIYLLKEDGTWQETPSAVNARHLVFSVSDRDQGFCVTEMPDHSLLFSLAGLVLLSVLLLVIRMLRHHAGRKKKQKSASSK